jgi:DNA helicase-2/ATP-dependent DNA helicase PcrA
MTKAFTPTPEQDKIIAHRGGHLQVIACAGAGKTEAISRRVSMLIEEGIAPAQIVAFTFTDRAAASLKTRITRRIADAKGQAFLDRLSPMFVGTIHAYCLHMLQDHVPEFGNFDILDENRMAGLLSREHKRLDLKSLGLPHWRSIVEFLRNADVIENELIDSEWRPHKTKNARKPNVFPRFLTL